jgi:hypothetical protein
MFVNFPEAIAAEMTLYDMCRESTGQVKRDKASNWTMMPFMETMKNALSGALLCMSLC